MAYPPKHHRCVPRVKRRKFHPFQTLARHWKSARSVFVKWPHSAPDTSQIAELCQSFMEVIIMPGLLFQRSQEKSTGIMIPKRTETKHIWSNRSADDASAQRVPKVGMCFLQCSSLTICDKERFRPLRPLGAMLSYHSCTCRPCWKKRHVHNRLAKTLSHNHFQPHQLHNWSETNNTEANENPIFGNKELWTLPLNLLRR